MARAQAGCHDAAREIIACFGEPLRRIIRLRLERYEHSLRKIYDEDDCWQSVFFGFFHGGLKHAFDSPEQLLAYLTGIAENKLAKAERREYGAQKRDRSRQTDMPPAIADQRPAPTDQVEVEDEWQALLATLSPEYQQALVMFRQGESRRDIAQFLGITLRSFNRWVADLRPRYQRARRSAPQQ